MGGNTTRQLQVTAVPFDGLVFAQEWLSGRDGGGTVEFALTCGAGLGSGTVTITVTVDGRTVRERFDVQELVAAWVDGIVADLRGSEQEVHRDPSSASDDLPTCRVCGDILEVDGSCAAADQHEVER